MLCLQEEKTDDCKCKKPKKPKKPKKMPNFAGKQLYPLYSTTSVCLMVDAGPIDLSPPAGHARGVTTADYNVRLRGKSERVDIEPQPPYPSP
jgi:hypothetical protein